MKNLSLSTHPVAAVGTKALEPFVPHKAATKPKFHICVAATSQLPYSSQICLPQQMPRNPAAEQRPSKVMVPRLDLNNRLNALWLKPLLDSSAMLRE
eukprot:2475916-Amphidinium_carterae.1